MFSPTFPSFSTDSEEDPFFFFWPKGKVMPLLPSCPFMSSRQTAYELLLQPLKGSPLLDPSLLEAVMDNSLQAEHTTQHIVCAQFSMCPINVLLSKILRYWKKNMQPLSQAGQPCYTITGGHSYVLFYLTSTPQSCTLEEYCCQIHFAEQLSQDSHSIFITGPYKE